MVKINLNLGDTKDIMVYAKEYGCTLDQAAYILATALHETAYTMKPVRETLARTDDEAIRRLERHFRNKKNKYWRRDREGKAWFGRGYVQLTFKDNYIRAGRKLGENLTRDPSRVMEPEIAKKILVRGMMEGWFTRHALPTFVNKTKVDFYHARKVVNRLDKAKAIANLALQYRTALRVAGYDRMKVTPAKPRPIEKPTQPKPVPRPTAPVTAPVKDSRLERLLKQIFKRSKIFNV